MLKFLKISLLCIVLVFGGDASAKVSTKSKPPMEKDGMYIIGATDMYPIEYYDEVTGEFKGALPELFEMISERSGIDFTYFYSKGKSRAQLEQEIKADIVTTRFTGENEVYYPNTVIVTSFISEGEKINVGWRVSKNAPAGIFEVLKEEVKKLTREELNTILIREDNKNETNLQFYKFIAIFSGLAAVLLLIFFIRKTKKLKREFHENELTDSATGIGNLLYFEKCFNSFPEKSGYIAYIIIDSNRLQIYHEEATFLDAIKYVADSLKSFAGEKEVVSRITENGFAFLFESTDDKQATDCINLLIEQLSSYFETDDDFEKTFFKIVAYKLGENDTNSDVLLFNLRRNCANLMETDTVFSMCTEKMMKSDMERKTFLDEIFKGFENEEFKLYLQFIIDNKTEKIASAEALARWEKENGETVMPAAFISVMEKTGIISKLDYYMFEKVCTQLHKWRGTEFEGISISCNFTRITLSEKDFVEHIDSILNRYVFDRSNIIIEMTEDALEKNREIAKNNILACKKRGFTVALDDLGSGYTSLANLCEYPIDVVKLDRSILLKTDSGSGRDLFSGIIALVHSLGLKVVCEGVETKEQKDYVHTSDCDYVQGWYFTKPVPVKQSENFYRNFVKVGSEQN